MTVVVTLSEAKGLVLAFCDFLFLKGLFQQRLERYFMGLYVKDSLKKIRAKAEARLEEITDPQKQEVRDTDTLIHELNVHQIELEMQNEELRRTQEKLEESRQKYTDLYNFAPVGYFVLDDKGHIVEVNLTGAAMAGIERSSLLKKLFTLCIRREDRDIFYLNYRQAAETKLCQLCELKMLGKKNGGELFVELTIDPIIGTAGKITQCRIVVTDITERKKAEELLRESEEKFRTIFEGNNAGILIADIKNKKFFTGNKAICDMLGYSIEEIKEIGISDIHPEEDLPFVEEQIDKLTKKEITLAENIPLKRKDGSIFFADINANPLMLSGKTYLIGSFTDITERKRTEEIIRNSEVRFKELFEHMSNAVAVYEPENDGEDFIFKDCNQALLNIEKVDKNQIIGRRVTEVFPGVKEFGLLEVLKRVYHTGIAEHFPVSLYKDQRISGWKENYIYKLLSGEVIAIYDDITDRKKAEEKLKETLSIKEVLLRELHHRVKNNMQVISSLLRLQSRTIDDRNTAEIFRECQDRIQAMALIHERFYHSEDLSSIDFETYIKELTHGLIQSYNISPDRITMSINIKDVPLEINEAISCGLIINELVSNSLKYAFPQDKKGKISISMMPIEKDEIELIISDNGVGIPAGLDYQKTETLGLQLVNTFVKDQLGGEIKLDRNAETKFKIKFKKKSVE